MPRRRLLRPSVRSSGSATRSISCSSVATAPEDSTRTRLRGQTSSRTSPVPFRLRDRAGASGSACRPSRCMETAITLSATGYVTHSTTKPHRGFARPNSSRSLSVGHVGLRIRCLMARKVTARPVREKKYTERRRRRLTQSSLSLNRACNTDRGQCNSRRGA